QPPTAEWGTMLADAREFIRSNPWLVTFPGLAILITVVAINLMGDGLRDALDPKMRRS
ncbi:MAG: dipeptide ABC transporter permease DppC, partial [Burkholderiales bacterium PBB5]